ncbi:MAG: glycerol kinase GlpK [Bdellovibrionales bacterium]|nr:glycerol kinase GlpK [Bdellovibrionales bacterium]
MNQYILAIDQGTTGTKVLLMDTKLNLVAEKSTPFEQHFPQPGWVEHDLDQIWASVETGIAAIVARVDPKQIAAIGITNQRETVCFWERSTNVALARAIVWQDRRTADRCKELRNAGLEEKIQKTTGLLLDPYFSSTKIEWMLKNSPKVANAMKTATLAVGTIDSFLLARLSGGITHATEPSNASRTMLLNLEATDWSEENLKLFGVTRGSMPKVQPSFSKFGVTKGMKKLPDGIPITGIVGDQQSALLGQACIHEGQAKCTYGTGAFLLMNTGSTIRQSKHRLLTTIAWTEFNGKTTYALEGSAFMAGATIQWLRDGLRIIKDAPEVEALAQSVPSTDGVFLVPAFTGLGAPYWDPNARAILCGMTRGTTKAHIARAALEGIAFQNVDILQAMEKDVGREISSLNVDGGACKNNLLMQIQSDLLGRKLKRPAFTETTSLGAVFAAGLGAGIWTSLSEIEKAWELEREFAPETGLEDRSHRLVAWQKAVKRAQ